MLVPGLLALVFGWLAFRSRVNGVYLSILTQAMTLALALYLFQNDSGLRGNDFRECLVHADGRPENTRPDVRDPGQLQHPLDGSVFAVGAVQQRQHDDGQPVR